MRQWWLGAAFTVSCVAADAEWTPPSNPDPQNILQEARADREAGRHAVALAKHLWFHHHALEHDPSWSGVRISFALSDWLALSQAYPPALEALLKTRDDAWTKAQSEELETASRAFHDFCAINDTLGERPRTAQAFAAIHGRDSARATRFFDLALPALVAGKHYFLCGKHLDPGRDWSAALSSYRYNRQAVREGKFGHEHERYTEKSFTNETTTLIALLVVNRRNAEAERIAGEARREWDDEAFRAAIDSALKGVVPDPWP